MYGNTEAIVVAPMLSHKSQIRLRERIPANQLSFVIRESQQLRSLGRSEDFAARHLLECSKNDEFQNTKTSLKYRPSVLQEVWLSDAQP
jgi:hypothetical protein